MCYQKLLKYLSIIKKIIVLDDFHDFSQLNKKKIKIYKIFFNYNLKNYKHFINVKFYFYLNL